MNRWAVEWTDKSGKHHFKLFKHLGAVNAYYNHLIAEGAKDLYTSAV